ncbi:MAG: flagellar biosynthetic protein FliR [Gammaproteobacteria bacterium]|nr:flagellar biosynthetic protein FliR [Gammaproteobacteria bacterium]
MILTGAEISAIVGTYLWPFIRITAMVGAMPVFSSNFIPVRIRLVIALAMTIVVVPIIPPAPAVDAISIPGALIVFQQIVIGIVSGFIFHLVINAFIIGGQVIAMQMGLGFATMVDPVNGAQAPVLSMFFLLMVTLFFILLDGHLALVGLIAKSFHTLPISVDGLIRDNYWQLVAWASEMFAGAVLVALPAVTSLLLVNMSLGVMGRAAPQLNIFAVGFSITITAGFYVILVSLPINLLQFENLSASAFQVVKDILRVN